MNHSYLFRQCAVTLCGLAALSSSIAYSQTVPAPVSPRDGQNEPAVRPRALQQNSDPQFVGPERPAPASPRPNVATFGNNRFANLTPSRYFASPLATTLGVGESGDSSALGSYFGSASHRNLLDVPEMFGDRRRSGSSILFNSQGGTTPRDNPQPESGDFPFGGTFSGMRASENNVSLPQDRVWMAYHHYHNGFALQSGDLDLNRFVLGVEKTFDGGAASLELRLPIVGSLDPSDPLDFTSFAGGSFGNLQILAKRVLVATEDRVLAAGLMVEAPTGSAWHAFDQSAGVSQFTLDPTAVYLSPYLGTLRTLNDIWFVNAFAQVEVATNGDRFTARTGGNIEEEYFINQPATFMLDLGGGVWLTKPDCRTIGLALITELHLATALADPDSFVVNSNSFPNISIDTTPIRNLLNATTGLHFQLDRNWSVRTAVSAPLLDDRISDTELMIQVNRNY